MTLNFERFFDHLFFKTYSFPVPQLMKSFVCFSPFKVRVMPGMDPGKVVVSGNGVQPRGVLASLPTTFLVDARKAGTADLDVMIQVRWET